MTGRHRAPGRAPSTGWTDLDSGAAWALLAVVLLALLSVFVTPGLWGAA